MAAPPTPLSPPGKIGDDKSAQEQRSRAILDLRAAYFFCVDDADDLWVYEKGRYVLARDSWTRNALSRMYSGWQIQGMFTPSFVGTVHSNLKSNQPKLEIRPPEGKVNLLNGIWDVKTGKRSPHDPLAWRCPVQIPIQFTPGAKAPAWEKLYQETLPADCQEFIWEVLGSCLVVDSYTQQVIWFAGEGGNGKGTTLLAWEAFIGEENCTSASFKDMTMDKFALDQLHGKLAMIDGDSSLAQIKASEVFKKVSAHDKMQAQAKFGHPYSFRPWATVIVAANGRPTSSDVSKGFFERPLIVPMVNEFRGTARERRQDEILAELAAENEGALLLALAGLQRLAARGRFEIPTSIAEATAEFKMDGNPVTHFAAAHIAQDPAFTTPESVVVQAAKDWATETSSIRPTQAAIEAWLRQNMPEIKRVRPGKDGAREPWQYRGLKLV